MTGLCANCGAPLALVHVKTEVRFCPGGACRKAGREKERREAKAARRTEVVQTVERDDGRAAATESSPRMVTRVLNNETGEFEERP